MGWYCFRWSSKGLGGMEVQVTCFWKPSNFKMYKASRVWRNKEKFHSSLFRCFRRRLWTILLFKAGRWSRESSLCFTDRKIKSQSLEIYFLTKTGTDCSNFKLRYHYCWDKSWEFPLTENIFGQIPRLSWNTSTTTAKNLRYFLQTGFNSSEKMKNQSNGSMCQPRKIQQMAVPED